MISLLNGSVRRPAFQRSASGAELIRGRRRASGRSTFWATVRSGEEVCGAEHPYAFCVGFETELERDAQIVVHFAAGHPGFECAKCTRPGYARSTEPKQVLRLVNSREEMGWSEE